jgi:hypothetical protein
VNAEKVKARPQNRRQTIPQVTNHRQDKRQLEVRARGARPSKHKNTNLQNTNTNPNTTLPLNTRQKSTKTQPSTREEEAAIQYV